MDKPKPKSRRQLNDKQKEILLILYKFRFASRDLIIKYQGLTAKTYTHYRLKILLEQEYIGRKFDGKAKIQGKPAAYYLLLNGIQILRKDSELNPKVLDITYRDKNAGVRWTHYSRQYCLQ